MSVCIDEAVTPRCCCTECDGRNPLQPASTFDTKTRRYKRCVWAGCTQVSALLALFVMFSHAPLRGPCSAPASGLILLLSLEAAAAHLLVCVMNQCGFKGLARGDEVGPVLGVPCSGAPAGALGLRPCTANTKHQNNRISPPICPQA
jgi:hypothetical protein